MPPPALDAIMATNFVPTVHHDTYPTIANTNNTGKVVLITGASRGIGRATAVAFARSGAAAIILCARSSLDETEQEILHAAAQASPTHRPPKVLKVPLDVTSELSVDRALQQVKSAHCHIDVLVNNAGVLEPWMPVTKSNPAQWWNTWDVNIRGVYLTSRAFLPLLLKSETKTFLTLSSFGAFVATPGASAYETTKLAIIRFTEFVAAEHRDQGLVAVALNPGNVETGLSLRIPEIYHSWLIDSPNLPADTACWLAAERRPWLSGRYVSANWDMDELLARKDEIVEGDKLKMRIVL